MKVNHRQVKKNCSVFVSNIARRKKKQKMFISDILYLSFLQFRRFKRLFVSTLQKPPPVFALTPCIQGLIIY
jgi:hypothetical protein